MKHKFKIIYIFIALFLVCIILAIYKEKGKKVDDIEISNLEEVKTLIKDDFKYSDIELTITYKNGKEEIINLSSSMMSKEDALKFKQVGEHEVSINYKNKSIKYYFTIVSGSSDIGRFKFYLEEDSYVYAGTPLKPNVIVDGMDLILDEDYSVEYINNTNAGTGVVLIKGINDYIGEKALTFTISKKTLIITADDITISGNEKPIFTVTYNGFVSIDDENSLMGSLKINCNYDDSISGNYDIIASGYTSNNYSIIYESGTLSVNNIYLDKANVELEYLTHAYTGRELKPYCLITIDGETVSSYNYEIIYEDNRNVGTAKLKIIGKNLYYGTIEKEFEITPVNLEISINNEEIKYMDLIPNYKINYIGFVNLDTEESLDGKLNITCDYDETAIGTYPLKLSGLTSNNYNIIYNNGTLTVNAREIDSATIEYDEITYAAMYITPEVKCYVGKNELTLNKDFNVKYENNYNSGRAYAYIEGQGNFKGTITKSFIINKAKLNIKVNNMVIEYNDVYPEFTYTTEGFKNEDDISSLSGTLLFNTTYKNNSPIGKYDVYVQGVKSDNYVISFTKGILTVNSKSIALENVILDKESFVYTGKEIYPLVKVTVNKDLSLNIDYKVEITDNLLAGNGKVIVTGIGNYTGIITKQFTISQKDLKIIINGINLNYGDDLPEYTLSYIGFVNGESINNLNGELLITTEYKKYSSAGNYPITGSGLSSNNYNIIYECGEVIVSPQNLGKVEYTMLSKTFVYNAKEVKPEISLSYMDTTLKENADYIVTIENNINQGKVTFFIQGINNYTGQIEDTFEIQKRDIIIKANDYNIKYLEEINEYSITITNLPDDYNEKIIKDKLITTSSYAKGKTKGEYEIIVSGFADDNFIVTYQKGIINLSYTDKFTGEGTFTNPYILSSVNDIMELSEKVLSGENYANKYFVLANDIDFLGYSLTPIGDKNHYFQGHFNGKGKEIKNYTIINSKSSYVGLFANVVNGEIINLGLNNVIISDNNCAILGTIVGFMQNGLIKNVYVKNAFITNKSSAVIGSLCGRIIDSKINNTYVVSSINLEGSYSEIGLIAGKMEKSTILSSYGTINANVLVTSGSIYGIVNSSNESNIINTFIDGSINVASNEVKIYEISESGKGTYIKNVSLLDTLQIIKNETPVTIKITKTLSEVISIFKENVDINDWVVLDNILPKLTFEENEGIKQINKPQSLKKEYDGESANYYGFTLDKTCIDAGTYEVTLKLKEGFIWSDGTTEDIKVHLEITKKNLYININSIHININDNYDLTFVADGLEKNDYSLLNEIILNCDYNLNAGAFLIEMNPIDHNNYNIIVRNGYLYASESGQNDWSVWDGIITDELLEGSGTSMDPYIIDSASKFACLAYKVENGESTNFYYELRTNIDLNYKEWKPIAGSDSLYGFEGYLNGNGYIIRNMKITKNSRFIGLFGYAKNCTIELLRLENVDIDLITYEQTNVGSLIGYAEGALVDNVSSTGHIKVNSLCSDNINCGGIIGYQALKTNLSNIYSGVDIDIKNSDEQTSQSPVNVGGITGYLQEGIIQTSYAKGNIQIQNLSSRTFVGGIIGFGNQGEITTAISYVDILLKAKAYYIDYIIGRKQQITATNVVAFDENIVTINGNVVTISIGLIYTSDELENFVIQNFDTHIWDIDDYLYPTLH